MIAGRRSAGLATCALLLGAGALFFWPIVAGRVPVFRDVLDSTAPLGSYIGSRLRTGHLPQWFPWDGLGLPFIGQLNEGTFHPINWLYAVLPLPVAVRWELLLGYCAAAFGQLLFARKLGLSWMGSALAAIGFAFCGYGISLSNVLPYLWGVAMLPWVGLLATMVCERASPLPWVAALALCWATIVLAGDSHSALFGGLIALFAAAHAGRLRRLPLCVLASLIAIGLAGAELLPAIDIVREGPRVDPTQNLAHLSRFWALHPHRLPELLFPGWLTSRPAHFLAAVHYRERGMWAISIYFGAPLLALALAGAFNRKRTALFAGAIALLGLWLATGSHGGLEPLARRLPLVNLLRYPEKYLALCSLAVPLAAAAGLDSLRKRRPGTPALALGAAAAACLLGAALLPADVALRIWPALQHEADLVPQIHQAWRAALLDSALALAGLAVILLGARRRPGLLWLAPLLVFLDLWRAGGSIIVTADPRVLVETPRFCVTARRNGAGPDGLRVVNVSARERRSDELEHPESWAADSFNELRPAENALCEIGSLWNNAVLSNEPRWIRWAVGNQHLERSAALVLYGFGLVVRTHPVDPPLPDETVLDSLPVNDAETLVLVRRPAAPRAYAAVPRWVPDGASALREVEAHGLALVESPVLAGSGPEYGGSGKAGEVRIVSYQPEHVVLDAEMTRSGAVVLNDLAARGWTATVDGAPARIYRANVLVRGVLVPEGKHRIEMSFELPRLRAGLALSGACLLLCGGLFLAGARRRRFAASADPGAADERELQRAYWAHADRAHFNWQTGNPYISRSEAELLESFETRAGERVLEVGCGEGANLRNLGARIAGVQVFAVDFSLAKAAFVSRSGWFGACANAGRLPFRDGSFDAVLVRDLLHHVHATERPSVLEELARVLKPGGRLTLIEPNGANPIIAAMAFLIRAERGMLQSRGKRMLALAREAGFTGLSVEPRQPFPISRVFLHYRLGAPSLARFAAVRVALGALERAARALPRSTWSYFVVSGRRP